MVSERDVFSMLESFEIPRNAKVTIHTSLRKIGGIEGGADGLIDAFRAYLSDGLFLVPTHTWATVNHLNPYYDVRVTKPCIGTLPTVAAFRPDGFRSLHPTHSMAGFGRDAEKYLAGEEECKTPAPVGGALSRLAEDENNYVLLIGVGHESNTFLHAVDEMADDPLPDHLMRGTCDMVIIDHHGRRILDRGFRTHANDGSEYFPNLERPFRLTGATTEGRLGSARVICGSCAKMADVMGRILARTDHDPFRRVEEISEDLYLD